MAITYCDRCFESANETDSTTIHIKAKGITHSFTYHNRSSEDCLGQKLLELKQTFADLLTKKV